MELRLHTVVDSDNVINKILNEPVLVDIKFKADTDISNPSLMLSDITLDYDTFNYAYIPKLKRYYFINNITNINNTMWRLDLSCDVLETYKNDILGSKARFYRNIRSGDYVNATIDEEIHKTVSIHNSDVIFDNKSNYVLSVIGE